MTLVSKPNLPPTFVGFDQLFDDIDNVLSHNKPNYPPYNIIKIDDQNFQIELAIAGFNLEDLDVEIKDQVVTVKGNSKSKTKTYVHQGISNKQFERSFRLHEYVEVVSANLNDGILTINLKYVVPEDKKPRKITIDRNFDYSHLQLLNESSDS